MRIFPELNVSILSVRECNSPWRTPAIAYNTGFNEAKGDIILLNSCDCIHMGNIIEFVRNNMIKKTYLSFATLAGTESLAGYFDSVVWDETVMGRIKELYGFRNGWWRSHKTNRILIPFCASIMHEDLATLNGYDERFVDGIGYDDCDFIDRVANLGLNMVLVDEPFCIHQYHELIQYANDHNKDFLAKLVAEQPNRIKAPENKIYVR